MKKNKLYLSALSITLIFAACEKTEPGLSNSEAGQKAAQETCKCLETKSESTCLSLLQENYGSYTNEEFVEAFNEAQTCDYFIWLERQSAKPNLSKKQ